MPELNLIEKEIKDVLDKYAANDYGYNAQWTKKIIRVLGKLGVEKKYKACAHNLDPEFPHEWLYDLVWYNMSGNSTNDVMTSMELAVECEWKTELWEIQKDFEKLLQTNAAHRLMICYVPKNEEVVWAYFENAIKKFRNSTKGDRYMIAMIDADYKFEYKLLLK